MNYEITTTSAIEFAFVALPDTPPRWRLPREMKLVRAQQAAQEGGEMRASLRALLDSGAAPRGDHAPRRDLEQARWAQRKAEAARRAAGLA